MPTRRQSPYETHERTALAATAIAQSYLAITVGMPLQLLVEMALRRTSGFADDTLSDAAMRNLVPACCGAIGYAATRFTNVGKRAPFVQATVFVLAISAVLGRSAHHSGGAVSPYVVSLTTLLFCWSLIMPGGVRYSAGPIVGALTTFYATLYFSGARAFFEVRATAFALFTVTSAFVALAYAEVLERWRTRVSTASKTDALTMLLNRAYLLERFEELHAEARIDPRAVSVLMIDVDHFKGVNDTHGHAVGDAVLRAVADVLAGATRRSDACGRVGGEEFVLVLDGCGAHEASEVGERVRQSIAELEFVATTGRLVEPPHEPPRRSRDASPSAPVETFRVTVSIGIASLEPMLDASPAAALREADRALYRSKAEGRDRVTSAGLVQIESAATSGHRAGSVTSPRR